MAPAALQPKHSTGSIGSVAAGATRWSFEAGKPDHGKRAPRRDVPEVRDMVEAGAAHLAAGEFMRNVPDDNGEGDVTYAYVQITLTF